MATIMTGAVARIAGAAPAPTLSSR
jgi:hypothetical protein